MQPAVFRHSLYAKKTTDLLLKVPPIFFVNKYQVEVIPYTEFLVDITECGRKVETSKE